MKKWNNPTIFKLGVDKTSTESDYIEICNWAGAEIFGLGNEEYADPNNKPANHPDWVWCKVHGRWHPKDHSGENAGNTVVPES
ncbi:MULTISPECIES: hypothetical protein [unclassified Clostridium]|uniref:hypothetical protein n=1 Tax=Clostridium TaxID=1485 RepID=UPI001C8BF07A|nr:MULTISPECIES: hypothetical protein [unclassified Clostridium]MBX9136372.1 hypothetical protein [Clostridium sp. K12(2020)]MBX9143356.1 hypothetical protein [Clostridium sp. K13]MDU2291310.1 hypothetical protein [Clostridium celatum]MDU4324059.1 hypothetical protein [Clostridium celatum]